MPDDDFADALHGFTNYVMNERVRCYNEGLDAGIANERERCAKIADNEVLPDVDDSVNKVAKIIAYYIRLGDTPV